jgi:hypothetical protein
MELSMNKKYIAVGIGFIGIMLAGVLAAHMTGRGLSLANISYVPAFVFVVFALKKNSQVRKVTNKNHLIVGVGFVLANILLFVSIRFFYK